MNEYEFVGSVRLILTAETEEEAREQAEQLLGDIGFFEGLDR